MEILKPGTRVCFDGDQADRGTMMRSPIWPVRVGAPDRNTASVMSDMIRSGGPAGLLLGANALDPFL